MGIQFLIYMSNLVMIQELAELEYVSSLWREEF